jgi:hypothetical protein
MGITKAPSLRKVKPVPRTLPDTLALPAASRPHHTHSLPLARLQPETRGVASQADPPGRWCMLALLSAVQLLGMSLWFSASAVAPKLWDAGITATEAGWLTTALQLGFVAGTAVAAVLNLADIVPAPRYVAVLALLGAAANAAIAFVPGFDRALVLRFLTGFALAGVYPPAMKMVATRFRAGRGVAIGTLVGALTVGKAAPYLLGGLGSWSEQAVVLAASAGAVLAALLVAPGIATGPFRSRDARSTGDSLDSCCGIAGHAWRLADTSATCGSCTRCGRRWRSFSSRISIAWACPGPRSPP